MLLLIDNYDSFTYNLYQYLAELGGELRVVRNDHITADDIRPDELSGIVISPGPGTPDQAGICLETVRRFSGVLPLLGICLGHQTIVQAFGGDIVRATAPVHGKASAVIHDGFGLFHGLHSPFQAGRYHSLIASRETLPECLEITAWTEDQLIMAVQHRQHPTFGVQFHPESILTDQGMHLLRNFHRLCRDGGRPNAR